MTTRTRQLKTCGQSLWLDNIQRGELRDGTIRKFIDEDGVCGITSNPTIFMKAVSKSFDYDEQIASLARAGSDAAALYQRITLDDIKEAGRLLFPVFQKTGGRRRLCVHRA